MSHFLLMLVCLLALWNVVGPQAQTCDGPRIASEIRGYCTSDPPSEVCCNWIEKAVHSRSCLSQVAAQPEVEHVGLTEQLLGDIFQSCTVYGLTEKPASVNSRGATSVPQQLKSPAPPTLMHPSAPQQLGSPAPPTLMRPSVPQQPPTPPTLMQPHQIFSPPSPVLQPHLSFPTPSQAAKDTTVSQSIQSTSWHHRLFKHTRDFCGEYVLAVMNVIGAIGATRYFLLYARRLWNKYGWGNRARESPHDKKKGKGMRLRRRSLSRTSSSASSSGTDMLPIKASIGRLSYA